MKEQTLYHLMIASGSAMANRLSEQGLCAEIDEVRKTLAVTSLDKNFYLITFSRAGEPGRVEVPKEHFEFHVRGDVKRLVEARSPKIDLRTKNWNAAVEVWKTILRGRTLPKSAFQQLSTVGVRQRSQVSSTVLLLFGAGLTPILFNRSLLAVIWIAGLFLATTRHRKILSLILLVASPTGIFIPLDTSVGLRLVLAILFFRVIQELGFPTSVIRFPVLVTTFLCGFAGVTSPDLLVAFGPVLLLEAITALVRQTRTLAFLLFVLASASLLSVPALTEVELAGMPQVLLIPILGLVLAIASAPLGFQPNTSRITSFVGLAVGPMVSPFGWQVSLVVTPLLVIALCIQRTRSASKTRSIDETRNVRPGSATPVTIRNLNL